MDKSTDVPKQRQLHPYRHTVLEELRLDAWSRLLLNRPAQNHTVNVRMTIVPLS